VSPLSIVKSINLGGVENEGTHALGIIGSDFEKEITAQMPLGRIDQPGDIAPTSPDSGWLSTSSASRR
jgi:3-oxoacyl-[acyl-carrier protein] reductase